MQKSVFIGAIAIVLIGVGIALYFLFFTGSSSLISGPQNPFEGADSGNVGLGGGEEDDNPILLGGASEEIAPRFVKITDGPVAFGAVTFSSSVVEPPMAGDGVATSTLEIPEKDYEVRYVERASGNVYSYLVLKQTTTRISNRTIPGAQEASWLPDGSVAYLRYSPDSKNVETYALPAEGAEGFFFEQNLSQALVQASGVITTALPSSSGTLLSFLSATGESIRPAIFIPLSKVLVSSLGETPLVTTHASSALYGYSFSVGDGGLLSRLVGPHRGLSVLPSPSGNFVLYSYVLRGALQTAVLNTETGETTPIPVATLAEKCVWEPAETRIYCAAPRALSGNLPDAWYQGAVSFSDRIWSIILTERVAAQIIDPEAFGETIDAVALTVDAEANVLVFTDKRSGALYLYDL
jgi:hypothetical protein